MNELLYNLIRAHYRDLQGYVSAGMEAGKDETKVFMNANENPYALPGMESYNRYPEPQPPALLDAYAGLYGVRAENIVATRGADEAIVALVKLFCEPHEDSVLITPPTFGMYGVDARAMPAGVTEVPLIEEGGTFRLDVAGIIRTVISGHPEMSKDVEGSKDPGSDPSAQALQNDKRIKLMFLCSPNNPTGTCFPREDMLEICRAAQGKAAVIVDETYIEFAEADSLTADIKDHPNLIILRTLSKSYALAGMRMGCMISGDEDFIALVRSKCLDAYPLPRASIAAALEVTTEENLKIAAANRATLLNERDRLRAAFEASELVEHIYPSAANFLLIKMNRANEFVKYCAEQKIILRDFSAKPGTENCIRISPDLPENNDRLITLLKNFVSL